MSQASESPSRSLLTWLYECATKRWNDEFTPILNHCGLKTDATDLAEWLYGDPTATTTPTAAVSSLMKELAEVPLREALAEASEIPDLSWMSSLTSGQQRQPDDISHVDWSDKPTVFALIRHPLKERIESQLEKKAKEEKARDAPVRLPHFITVPWILMSDLRLISPSRSPLRLRPMQTLQTPATELATLECH